MHIVTPHKSGSYPVIIDDICAPILLLAKHEQMVISENPETGLLDFEKSHPQRGYIEDALAHQAGHPGAKDCAPKLPPKRSDAWLKMRHVARTGECRVPGNDDLWEPLDGRGKAHESSYPWAGKRSDGEHFDGRRWLLRDAPPEPEAGVGFRCRRGLAW
ncbi:MAG: hypothetical protein GY851_35635 [bacterium]|nr:hypothetical protein [bacterium]